MKLAIILLLLPFVLSAQHINYSTVPAPGIDATVWHINVCSATAVTLPGGLFYGHLAAHGAKPLFNVEALAVFNQAPSLSVPYRIVEYSGWAAAGAGLLMTTDTIKVTQEVKVAVNFGSAFLNIAIPLVRSKIPAVSPLRDQLIGTALSIPAGGCGQGILLGGPANDFEVTL